MTITTRIAILGALPVALCTGALIGITLFQRTELRHTLRQAIDSEAVAAAERTVRSVQLQFEHAHARTGRQLDHSLQIAGERFHAVTLGTTTVAWEARNQFTGERQSLTLPPVQLAGVDLGQNFSPTSPTPVVDEIHHATRDHVTLFQRMNEAGDMLRVATSLVTTNGQRAIGTFIPARLPDGAPNPVITTVLQGTVYAGRARVLSEWFDTRYQPLWDADHQQVIGMVFVGTSLTESYRELRENLLGLTIGKTGYPYILTASGPDRGRYILSQHGKRDGEVIWEARDAGGRPFIQDLIQRAVASPGSRPITAEYDWKNAGDAHPRRKYAAAIYFAPYDWVIGIGAYQDEHHDIIAPVETSLSRTIAWIVGVSATLGALALVVGISTARSMTRPLLRTIGNLRVNAETVTSAAGQIRDASESVADGASSQAASLEESSASLEEMTSMTRRNADHASDAQNLAVLARSAADAGAAEVAGLHRAMAEIEAASDDVGKVTASIEEIAFQTNILALNAAVEAARAGEAGMGFAVVADEVRSLAQRSSTAAREAATLIQNSVDRAHLGSTISTRVGEHLGQILRHCRELDERMVQIASAVREQSQGLQQVSTAVTQIDSITQANAAGSRESADAAGRLSSQAEQLRRAVDDLTALALGRPASGSEPASRAARTAPPRAGSDSPAREAARPRTAPAVPSEVR